MAEPLRHVAEELGRVHELALRERRQVAFGEDAVPRRDEVGDARYVRCIAATPDQQAVVDEELVQIVVRGASARLERDSAKEAVHHVVDRCPVGVPHVITLTRV